MTKKRLTPAFFDPVRPPCNNVCQDMVVACSPFFAAQGKLDKLPNCSAVDPTTKRPLFPPAFCNNASQDVGTRVLLCLPLATSWSSRSRILQWFPTASTTVPIP